MNSAEKENVVHIGKSSPFAIPKDLTTNHSHEEILRLYRSYLANKIISRDPTIEVAIRSLHPHSKLVCACEDDPHIPCYGSIIMEFYHDLMTGPDYEHGLRAFKEKHTLDRIPYDPFEDGVTHINVYSKGKTPLGRSLSNFANTPFEHPEYGYFSSIEGFWYWLSTGGNRNEFRALHGFKAKEVGRLIREELQREGGLAIVEDFDAKIKKAILCKIEQNTELRKALKESSLPLTHYYIWGTEPNVKITYPENYAWIHEYISDVREWLNGRAYKLIIAGSRSINDYGFIEKQFNALNEKVIEIVSGRAPGVDRIGELIAKHKKLPVAYFPANWDEEGKSAGYIRNAKMADYGDAGLIVWDGESKGSINMKNNLEKRQKPVFFITHRLSDAVPVLNKIMP